MRYRLTLEYAGTRYSGWQIQQNARTVQGALAASVRDVCGTDRFELYGSGRTDSGVHALAQVAHLDVGTNLPPETLRRRLNEQLPSDINVLQVAIVPHRFHARHSAIARSYVYVVARRRTAFGKPFVWWVKDPLDVERMREVAALFEGRHDFRAFSDQDPGEASTEVVVESCRVHEDGDLLLVHIEGSHFIWKMVRRLVGVMVEAGRGQLAAADVPGLFAGGSDLPARLTAPAAGLFLERVYYEGDPRDLPVVAPVVVLTP